MINQSLCTGIFPEKLKVAKVIPLYKKGDNHLFDNYRPISLLLTVSKIFREKRFLLKYITIFALINYSMKPNTVSENVIQLNLQQLNLWIVFPTILMPVKSRSQFS